MVDGIGVPPRQLHLLEEHLVIVGYASNLAFAAGERDDLKRNLVNQGFDVRVTGPAEFAAFSASEIERWAQMVKEAKIDPE